MDFLEKGIVILFQLLFRDFTLILYITIRLLDQTYHFRLLICDPYSFIIELLVLMMCSEKLQ